MNFYPSSDLHARKIDVTRRKRWMIQEWWAWNNDRTGEHRPVPDLVDADLLAHGVTRVTIRESGWSAPVAAGWPGQVGDRRTRVLRMACTGGAFATGILDFGWGARSQESSTQAPHARRLFSWLADSSRLSLSSLLSSLPVLACSCLLAGGWYESVTYPCPPAPTCPPYLCPYLCLCLWPCPAPIPVSALVRVPVSVPVRRYLSKDVYAINNCLGDVVWVTREHVSYWRSPQLMTLRYSR